MLCLARAVATAEHDGHEAELVLLGPRSSPVERVWSFPSGCFVIPPAEQTITTPKGVKVSINDDGKSPFQEEATCCWCCSSAPIPEQKDQKEQTARKKENAKTASR